MSMYYDSGYEFANIPIYIGVGDATNLVESLPFVSQAELIKTYQREGRIEVSSIDVLTHGAVMTSATLGTHWATTKGFLDPALFSLNKAHFGMRQTVMRGMLVGLGQLSRGIARASPYLAAGAFIASMYQYHPSGLNYMGL